jgi:hypothetical protein
MIRHLVMWNVKGDNEQEKAIHIEMVRRAFLGLKDRIPGLVHLEIGVDISRVGYACDMVLVTDFESVEALNAYAGHPEHLRVREELGDLRIARHQVDYHLHMN